MIKKVINITIIGNKAIIKCRVTKEFVNLFSKDLTQLNVIHNSNIIPVNTIKLINNKTIEFTYNISSFKNFKNHCLNEGLDLYLKINSMSFNYSFKNIKKDIIYTSLTKRVLNSKKYNDFLSNVKNKFTSNQVNNTDLNFNKNEVYVNFFENEEIEDNIILYESNHGKIMGCNPYAIFKYLINDEKYKNFKHVWVLNDLNNCKDEYLNLENVEFVKVHSLDYLRYLCKAKYLINNTTFPSYFIRKENQFYLNTWHGTPLKTLGKYMNGTRGQYKNIQRNFIQSTHIINPNKFTADIINDSHDLDGIYNGYILNSGYPRVDITLNSKKDNILNMLNIDKDKKIILYAPTWRGEVGNVDTEIDKFINDYKYLLDNLKDEYNVLIRVHTLMQKTIIEKGYGDYLVDSKIDTNELLSVVDLLISDYSSIIFDFMSTKKPIFLYCYDKEKYSNERGFLFNVETLPVKISTTISDLLSSIEKCNRAYLNNEKYNTSYNLYNYNDDGNATKRVVDFFFENNLDGSYKLKDNKKNILMYCGGFLNNGITTSAINLLNNIDYNLYNVVVVDKGAYDSESEFNISKLNKNVKLIYRVGNMLHYKNEKIIEKLIFDNGLQSNLNEEPDMLSLYKREYKRLFGDIVFDVAIDFSGYNKFWTLIFASSLIPKKIIYQHNDMLCEYNKIINGKLKHKKNLDVIFPLYNNFDKIVSVANYTMNVNKNSLCDIVENANNKFAIVNNSINYNNIFSLYNENNLIEIQNKSYHIKNMNEINDNLSLDVFPRIDENKINFINIARMSPEKDQIKLLHSFSKIVKDFDNAMLYIAGDGVLRKEIEDTISFLNLKNNVILTGQLKNPFEIAKYCDCFILSSNHEGQPMVLLEMLVIGKDIIATDIPGNRSVLEDGYGILCENSEDGLYNAMKEYILNGINGKKSFDYSSYNQQSMNMFYDILNN